MMVQIQNMRDLPNTVAAMAIDAILQSAMPNHWSRENIDQLLQLPTTFGFIVAYRNAVAGFIVAARVMDEAEILSIAIEPVWQKKGFGEKLLRHFIDYATHAGAARIFLDVASDNVAAQKLYRKCGFSDYGRRPQYYLRPNHAPRVDAVLMQRVAAG